MENQPLSPPKNNLQYKARRILILGVSRTGKSTLAARLIDTHPAPLVLIYDWQGCEYGARLGAIRAYSREQLAERIEQGHRVISYGAEDAEDDPTGEGFDWFCGMVYELAGQHEGRMLFVVDECQDLIDPYNMPENLSMILARGGRREIDTCIIGASANALQSQARNQVSELYVFRCIDENALKYPASFDLDPDRIKALPDTHFIFQDMRTGEQKELELWGKKSKSEKDS